ncbi:FAD-dependent oxidoreductase, partial [Actinophytocola sp.]|uniref:oxidoreductase n=1 Tax=Actinophytocola sp. TaxID=1872138 RepID=UPI002ED4791B
QICPESDYTGFLVVSRIWDNADVRNWSLVTDRIHAADSLAGIELATTGSGISGFESRLPARTVSNISDDHFFVGASYMRDRDDIRQLQADYVAAAKRARDAGFDIINIHGSEAWSICSMFLMRLYNHRTDEYGGSLANRARFWLETLELVKEAVGDDCAIAARHCIDSLRGEEGIRVDDDGIGFIELADHLVDLWDLQVGGEDRNHWAQDVGPSRFYGENFQGEWVSKVRPHTSKPIVAVGRFTSPDSMVAVIRSGQQDIIGAARASISDPFLPVKIDEGRIDDIRECIGCNVCVSRINAISPIVCTQNATIGEEYRRGWHPERVSSTRSAERSVLVVGAGPAGLECGIVLAQQGVEYVHVVDGSRHVGGHFHWVPRLPGLAEWIRVVDYRKAIAERLSNLAVVPNKPLSLEDILEYGADRVILATGSRWARDGLNGINQGPVPGADAADGHVFTPEQIMVDGAAVPGDHVIIYDCEGYFMGVSLAERLALEGKRVTFVTPLASPGPYLEYTGESQMMTPRLHELGVELAIGYVIDQVSQSGASGFLRDYPVKRVSWSADAVVLTTQRVPNDGLYRELKRDSARLRDAGISELYRVGDCVAPRPQVADAIFDAHRLAREIDSDDPATPLPWIRENRWLGAIDADYDEVVGGTLDYAVSSATRARIAARSSF